MTAAESKRGLSDVPEAGVITLLLNEVTRTLPTSVPGTVAAVERAQVPSVVAPPPGVFSPPAAPPPLAPSPPPGNPTKSGFVPVGALSVADFFALVNWKNRPEEANPLPTVAPERPPGHEWTVGAVMSAFFGD